jgi:hypothetical protein
LFYPECIYRYVSCVKAMSMSRGKTTACIVLDSPRPMAHMPLHIH